LIDALSASENRANTLFLPLGHDRDVAARLRMIGWRTIAALSQADDAKALGCTHRLDGSEAIAL
jgi:ATP phosphoribosyltransferase regulatory subunit